MATKPTLSLVEATRSFEMGKVQAGSSKNKWRNPLDPKRIDQRGTLNRKGSSYCRIHVCLAIVNRAFHGQISEHMETKLTAAKPVRMPICRIKIGRTPANREKPNIHVIEETFRSRYGHSFIKYSA